MQINFMSYNIQYGMGQDWKYDLSRTIEVIKDQDIVCLQEVTTNWPVCNREDQPVLLSEGCNKYTIYAPGFDVDDSHTNADGTIVNSRRGFGNMILSRWPILYSRAHSLPRVPVEIPPEFFPGVDFPRVALEAVIDVDGHLIRVISVHLSHLPGAQREGQIDVLRSLVCGLPQESPLWDDDEQIKTFLGGSDAPGVPETTLLAGDYNFKVDDPAMAQLLAPLPDKQDGLIDAWQVADAKGPVQDTCRESAGDLLRIDYLIATSDLKGKIRSASVDQSVAASDHFPVSFVIDL